MSDACLGISTKFFFPETMIVQAQKLQEDRKKKDRGAGGGVGEWGMREGFSKFENQFNNPQKF